VNKNITKIVLLVIFLLILVYVLYTRVFTKSQAEKDFEANLRNRPSGQASTPAGGPPAAEATPKTGGAATQPPVASEGEVNLKELAAGIKEVGFDYDAVRKKEQLRNPMSPLVGPYVAPAVLASAEGGPAASATDEATISAIRRNLLLSGIVWHATAPIAIINNEPIAQGYTFPGEMFRTARSQTGVLDGQVSLERITKNSVILKYKDSEITLELKER